MRKKNRSFYKINFPCNILQLQMEEKEKREEKRRKNTPPWAYSRWSSEPLFTLYRG